MLGAMKTERAKARRVKSRLVAALVLAVALAVLSGCADPPTPAGTKVLDADTTADLPEELRAAMKGDAPPATAAGSFKHPLIRDQGEIQIDYTTVTAPSGGKYITSIDVTVNDAAGYVVTAGTPGNPVNMGTEAAPVHTRMVSVAAFKSSWGSSTGGTFMFEVRGDGTAAKK
jgi:hypothetical protein